MNKISLAFINPDLIRDFLGSDKINIYQKADIFTKNRAMLGLGSFFVEKAQWKQHRKMLSKIFNFELVKTAIPKMC
jgi:cytochrome P450